MTHTLTVARHPRRGGRAPDRPRFFSQEHVGDKHAARRLMELPPVFDRGVWVWDEIRQDARPRLPFACMHARARAPAERLVGATRRVVSPVRWSIEATAVRAAQVRHANAAV